MPRNNGISEKRVHNGTTKRADRKRKSDFPNRKSLVEERNYDL